MNDPSRVWYIPVEGQPPAGPFTADEVLQAIRDGRLDLHCKCWRDGMPVPLPLDQLEPFAAPIPPLSDPSPTPPPVVSNRRISPRAIAVLVGVVVLLALLGAIFEYRHEAATIAQANKLISSGKNTEASLLLKTFLRQARIYPLRNRTQIKYLIAWASTREYAAASTPRDADDGTLDRIQRNFEDIFAQGSSWQRRAASDIGSIIGSVPLATADVLPRSVRLASLLEALELAGALEDARALLAKAEAVTAREGQGDLEKLDASIAREILSRDPSLADSVVSLAMGKRLPTAQGLARIEHWATQDPSLADPLAKGLLQIAEQYVGKARYSDLALVLATLKQVSPATDVLAIWQRYFEQFAEKNPVEANRILTAMVHGGKDPDAIDRAIKLYGDLKTRHDRKTPTPPNEIAATMERTDFDAAVADARLDLKNGQFQEAANALERARKRSGSLWTKNPDLQALVPLTRFGIVLEEAQKNLKAGDMAAAELTLKKALALRPPGNDAARLWNDAQQLLAEKYMEQGAAAFQSDNFPLAVQRFQKAAQILPDNPLVQDNLDRALAETHRLAAEQALAANDHDRTNDEILAARAIFDAHAQSPWCKPLASAIDALAKTTTTTLRQTAVKLSDQKQYPEARRRLQLALRLLPKDPELEGILQTVEHRAADPKTASLSGIWLLPKGGKCEINDDGSDVIHFTITKQPEGVASCSGEWRRKGDKLDGRFSATFTATPQRKTEGVVPAFIKDAETLSVFWNEIMWLEKPANATWTWRGKGEVSWKKEP
jgi:tetratricopeptide (TPR) repeat protein